MAMKIPKGHRASLLALAQLSPEDFGRLIQAIQNLPPRQVLVELRNRLIGVMPGLDLVNRRMLAESLVSMYASMLRGEIPVGQFVEDLTDAVTEQDSSEDVRETMRERLGRLLNVTNLRLSAKATVLRVDHERVYNTSRVISDLRPVFDEPVEEGLSGFMIIHQLKIVSLRHGEPEELFFAMDDNDLALLKKTLDRAELKSKQIHQLLIEKNLPQFDGES